MAIYDSLFVFSDDQLITTDAVSTNVTCRTSTESLQPTTL